MKAKNFSKVKTRIGNWVIEKRSIGEVGCIHTFQGLEFDYVGVVMGSDLNYRNGEIIVNHEQRAKNRHITLWHQKSVQRNPRKSLRNSRRSNQHQSALIFQKGLDRSLSY